MGPGVHPAIVINEERRVFEINSPDWPACYIAEQERWYTPLQLPRRGSFAFDGVPYAAYASDRLAVESQIRAAREMLRDDWIDAETLRAVITEDVEAV